jgi:2-polyprenyl-6-methoxyphenol hydroxylase-like FAD-dependent oxidoreductase
MKSAGYDAIIIGAGPAGASAAILLAQNGWRIAIVEKQGFPRRKVCGECIAASNLPLLATLGIGQAISDLSGPPLQRTGFMVADQTIVAALPVKKCDAYPWAVALGREYLDTILLEQAIGYGVTVYQPWTAHSIIGEPGNFLCEIVKVQSTERMVLNAGILIAAHGSWELAPSTRGRAPFPPRPSDLFAFKANFRNTGLEAGFLPVLSFAGGYGGMVVGNDGIATLAFCIRRDVLALSRKSKESRSAAESAFAYVTLACPAAGKLLAGAKQEAGWLSVGPIHPGLRFPKQSGGPFLIGNAAGEAHPIIGEGMSMAIQSAFMLADRLAPHKERLLQTSNMDLYVSLQRNYVLAWKRQFGTRIRLAALLAQLAMRPGLAAFGLPLLKTYPQFLTHAARWSGKVQCATLTPRSRLPEINHRVV